MRVAVLSDIHGNAVALQAMIASARTAGVDAFWVVGDLVANGPQPAETLELLRSLPNLMAVRGNTDRYVMTGDLRGMIPPIDRPITPQEVDALVAASAAQPGLAAASPRPATTSGWPSFRSNCGAGFPTEPGCYWSTLHRAEMTVRA